jgi:hypothetical protein
VIFYACEYRNTSYTCNEILRFISDANKPLWLISRRGKGPFEELSRIVESECIVVIFYVIVGQEDIHFLKFFLIFEVDFAPEEIFIG